MRLGALDGGSLSNAEQADIGLAALWQLAARAMDLLCAPPLKPQLLSAACGVVFAFLADGTRDSRESLPAIVERYAAPPLVVTSLLIAAQNVVDENGNSGAVEELCSNPVVSSPKNTYRNSAVRPVAAAAAIVGAVSAVAQNWTPRAITNLASSSSLTMNISISPSSVLRSNILTNPGRRSFGVHQPPTAELRAASDALCLLLTLVATDESYRDALLSLRDRTETSEDEDIKKRDDDIHLSFRNVYNALCFWAPHPAVATLTETLLAGNRKFRAYTLSRTDPETLLIPLLHTLYRHCTPSQPPSNSYSLAASLLILSSDRGFCEAIDTITISPATVAWADPRGRLANVPQPSLSALVLFVGARAVQQSLLSKRDPPQTYTASLALSAMANVATATTTLHAPMADRLVSLLDFLGRRTRRACIMADASIRQPPGVHLPDNTPPSPRTPRGTQIDNSSDIEDPSFEADVEVVHGGREKSAIQVRDTLISLAGLALEIVAGVLRSKGDVSSNRHLVYALLHREHLVRRDGPLASLSTQCRALCSRLEKVVRYFGVQVDRVTPAHVNGADTGTVLSVERVFAVIDESARLLPPDLLSGLPALKFEYRTRGKQREAYMQHAAWAVVRRIAPHVAATPDNADNTPVTVKDALKIPPPSPRATAEHIS